MARITKFLSFSNVVACLALFIALGGSVYAAATISGKQIKRSSLPGNRIKPKTVAANRIKPKSLTGRQVKPKSLTGAQVKPNSLTATQVNQKTLTGISAAALANVQYEVTTSALASNGRPIPVTANCPSGSYAIGGGATVSNENAAAVNDSGPSPLRTGWTATGWSFGAGNTMTVTAVCVVVDKPGGAVTTAPPPAPSPPPQYFPEG